MNTKKKKRAGRRVYQNPAQLLKDWNDYKKHCDSQTVTKSQFSTREGRYISEPVPSPITYTQLGFLLWIGLSESTYYAVYAKDPAYAEVIATIAGDCEVDARRKFEQGAIPSQLAGLWMSRYGYSTKTEQALQITQDDTTQAMDDFFNSKKSEN